MNILLLADLHGRSAGLAELWRDAGPFDLALLLGDITNFGDGHTMGLILDAMAGWPVLGVAGNCDGIAAEREVTKRGINLDGNPVVRGGICFAGAGRSLPCPGTTPNEVGESDFQETLSAASRADAILPMVLVTHQPPLGTDADLTTAGRHVGSSVIRQFIEEHRPILACCGHIHEARSVSKLGVTTLVNPGPWRNGFYAVAELTPGGAPVVELRQA